MDNAQTNRYTVTVKITQTIDAPGTQEAADKARDLITNDEIEHADANVTLEAMDV